MSNTPTMFAAGRYRVLSSLGTDAGCEVYRAFDARLDAEKVIKVLTVATSRNASLKSRFSTLARVFQEVDHPGIVHVDEVALEGRLLYAVSDPLPGENLEAAVATLGPLSPRDAAGLAEGILRALKAIHSHGSVLKGLTASDIWVDQEGAPRLCLVGRLGPMDATASSEGMASAYRPPELADPMAVPDARADLFSVGQILRFLLAGMAPSGPIASEEVPEALYPILARATAINPDQRYAGAGDMLDALTAASEQLGEGEQPFRLRTMRAPAPEAPPPPRISSLQRAAPLIFVAMILVSSVTLGIVMAMWPSTPTAPTDAASADGPKVAAMDTGSEGPAAVPSNSHNVAVIGDPPGPKAPHPPKPLPPAIGATGTLHIETRPVGAILVDGYTAGTAPEDLTLSVGSHAIRVIAPGFPPMRMEENIAASGQSSFCWDFNARGPCS